MRISRKYNCFTFALGLDNDINFTFQDNIPPTYNIDASKMEIFLQSFIETKNPKKGDIVIYRNADQYINHSSIFINKWKAISIWMEKEICPSEKLIREEKEKYGDRVTFYKKPDDFNPYTLFVVKCRNESN